MEIKTNELEKAVSVSSRAAQRREDFIISQAVYIPVSLLGPLV